MGTSFYLIFEFLPVITIDNFDIMCFPNDILIFEDIVRVFELGNFTENYNVIIVLCG